MAKALVTGGAGLIGSHIVDQLLARGDEVRILDNLSKPTHLLGKPSWVPPQAEFILGDMRNRKDLEAALDGVDLVFHQAAAGGFMPEVATYFHTNAVGTALMFEIMRDMCRRPRKVVVASSQAVYGEGKYFCDGCRQPRYPTPRLDDQLLAGQWEMQCPACGAKMRPIPTDEARVDPRTPYAMSKYAEEMIAINCGRAFDIPTVALRYSVTYGPRQSIFNPYTGICSIFSTRLLNDLPPVVYEDGQQTRDFVYVEDVARANLLVADQDQANYRVYNVGTGRPTSVLRFIELLAGLYHKPARTIQRGEFRPGEVRHLFADNSRIRALGWRPTVPVEEGLRRYAAWIASQKDIRDYFGEAEALMKRAQVVRQAQWAAV